MNVLGKKKAYELTDEEKAPVIKTWLGMEGLQFIKTYTNEEKEKCITAKELFSMLSSKFRPHHNRILLLLYYLKLKRNSYESAEEWMGRLQTKASDCDCSDYDRRLN